MRNQSIETGPVGVVPRRRAGAIQPLMTDQPDHCTVAESVEPPEPSNGTAARQWLTPAASFGIVAAALEWLKLTR